MTKGEIRIYQKKLRSQLEEAQKLFYDECILNHIMETKEYQDCKRVFTYVSFQSEIDTFNIMEQAFLHDKQVYIPKVEAHGLEFYEIKNLKGLVRSSYGILEPTGNVEHRFSSSSTPKSQKENLMLLPGLAFDPYGNRIGYGAGYYDKYLVSQGVDTFYKLALAYEFQILERVPSEDFDIHADAIITPIKSYQCKMSM